MSVCCRTLRPIGQRVRPAGPHTAPMLMIIQQIWRRPWFRCGSLGRVPRRSSLAGHDGDGAHLGLGQRLARQGTLPETGFWASARWEWMRAVAHEAEAQFAHHHRALMQPLWTDFLAHESKPSSVVTSVSHTVAISGGGGGGVADLVSGPGTGGGQGAGSGGLPLAGMGAGASDPRPGGSAMVMTAAAAAVAEPSSIIPAASGLVALTILGLLGHRRRS